VVAGGERVEEEEKEALKGLVLQDSVHQTQSLTGVLLMSLGKTSPISPLTQILHILPNPA
jgi:hypothetical protein